MMRQMAEVLSWYDGMTKRLILVHRRALPAVCRRGAVPVESPLRFQFSDGLRKSISNIRSQDSGNICFGAEGNHCKQYFLKFAGAPTACYEGSLTEA